MHSTSFVGPSYYPQSTTIQADHVDWPAGYPTPVAWTNRRSSRVRFWRAWSIQLGRPSWEICALPLPATQISFSPTCCKRHSPLHAAESAGLSSSSMTSRTRTLLAGSALKRLARIHPDVPPPTRIKSNLSSPSKVLTISLLWCRLDISPRRPVT